MHGVPFVAGHTAHSASDTVTGPPLSDLNLNGESPLSGRPLASERSVHDCNERPLAILPESESVPNSKSLVYSGIFVIVLGR